MTGSRLVTLITDRSRTVIALLLVVTLVVGAGATQIEENPEMEMFDEDPPEVEAREYVEQNFTGTAENTTHLSVVVRNESGNVLDRESLLASLRYQRALRADGAVNRTLAENGTIGIGNVVATALLDSGPTDAAATVSDGEAEFGSGFDPESLPGLDAQIEQLESTSDQRVEQVVGEVLDPESRTRATELAMDLLPSSYVPGSTTADARLLVVTQETDGQVLSAPELSEEVRTAQETAREIASGVDEDEYLLVGQGLMVVEEQASTSDSLALVGPIALLFVLVALGVAYRDFLDLALGLVGILLVLTWTFGTMGWLGIDFNILLIATPVLLVGLSIDYCLHVVMRYREERSGNGVRGRDAAVQPIRAAMGEGLTGLGPALVLVTLTAMIGFLSITASGVPALGAFGIATAAGVLGSLVVFGGFVPALKVELEAIAADRGLDRTARAFGTTGRLRRLLAGIARVSHRRPGTIILLVLVVSSLGAAAGTQLDSEFATDEYIAEDPPDWTHDLPGPVAPDEYEIRESIDYLFANFQSPDQQVHYLLQGSATDPATLERAAAIERDAANTSVTFERPTGEPAVSGPIGTMHAVAATNETVAAELASADTTGDGIPDRNVEAVLDSVVDAAPDRAERFVHRTENGHYEALRVALVVDGTADATTIADETRAVATSTEGGPAVTVTGQLLVNELVQRQLSTTLVRGLVVALAAVLAVLVLAFRYTRSSASLGVVTLLPVGVGLCWVLGGMYVAGIPFSFGTAMIGSIAIGLGVDYAIHMSERYSHELAAHGDVATALEESVVGTGGALLGSAVTTAAGFGVLGFSLVPVMQQFGVVIALAIVFAFAASVLVLPSVLVVWTRYLHDGPGGS